LDKDEQLFHSLEQRGLKPCPRCGGTILELKTRWIVTLDLKTKTYNYRLDRDATQEGKCLNCGNKFYGIPFMDWLEAQFEK